MNPAKFFVLVMLIVFCVLGAFVSAFKGSDAYHSIELMSLAVLLLAELQRK